MDSVGRSDLMPEQSREYGKIGEMEQHSEVSSLSGSAVSVPKRLESSSLVIPQTFFSYRALTDTSLFSSSQPVLPYLKMNFADSEHSDQSIENNLPIMNKLKDNNRIQDPLEDVDPSAIGSLLPDDEELLAGMEDDFDLSALPSQLEDLEDDLFDSGGGMEMDFDLQGTLSTSISKINISEGFPINGSDHYAIPSGVEKVSGEHPLGEHPSRTLFVRNINSNVEDTELRALFEQYGDIRNLYTSCKHRGFVMISYYDIRAARTAMRALQNKPLRRRKLDIHFSIPKDNPSEKDINQGTLVIFNLDTSVSNDELLLIFGAYGEVKEVRETPHKRHHKFIEYYDVRAAEVALKALNGSDIAGKRIKLEPSRPGGARRNLLQQLSQDMEPDEARKFFHHVGSPVTNSPPGNWGHFGSPVNRISLRAFSMSPCLGNASPVQSNHLPGLASILSSPASNSVKMAVGKDHGGSHTVNPVFLDTGPAQGSVYKQPSSFPKQNSGARTGPIAFGETETNIFGMETVSSPQFLWGSPKYSEAANLSSWASSSMDHSLTSSGQVHGFQYPIRHGSFLGPPYRVGSAPSGVPLHRHFGYLSESPKASLLSPVQLRGIASGHKCWNSKMNISSRANAGLPVNMTDNGSPSYRAMSLPMHGIVFPGNGLYHGPGLTATGTMAECDQSWRVDGNAIQADNKKQYQLDLDKIITGEDTRTTLMIKNIPNKYTSKMLLAAIDESHRGSYDFMYLPIDFKNKCNVGYAFINMLSPSDVVSFHKAFNGKRWEKFNSEKVAILAYARIQGKTTLVAHFQNSSLMNEDKRCRPIVFRSEGEELGAHEMLFSSNLNICIRQPDGSYTGDLLESPKSDSDEYY